jgi:hypothetical protein
MAKHWLKRSSVKVVIAKIQDRTSVNYLAQKLPNVRRDMLC